MNIRYYNPKAIEEDAGQIAREVITCGKSEGWCGNTEEDLKNVVSILKDFNIHYVDDMRGTWEHRQP